MHCIQQEIRGGSQAVQRGEGGAGAETPAGALHSAAAVLYPQLFCQLGNSVANQFWAANIPPSEAINPASGSQERRRFLVAKYKEGKYRRYHPLFGNQEELNKVGCLVVSRSRSGEGQVFWSLSQQWVSHHLEKVSGRGLLHPGSPG